ncbi:MAG: ABC transporter permease [Clostridia bacterium]|nr:ABC transporter permease [Clostridia bacterium]
MTAVFKREFKSYFSTPIGYIVVAAYFFFLGLYFTFYYSGGSPDIASLISGMSTIAIFTVPILTMRLMSEDRRQKVDQALLTAPVSLTGIVMGKFLAALAVYAIGFAPTVIFEIIIMSYVTVNIMSYIYALIGIILLGGALIAIGMFISSLTESSVISGILTLVINILIIFMSSFSSMVSSEWLATAINKLAIMSAFENFITSMFSIANIVYFLSIMAIFIFLSIRSLEKRRWS